MSDTPLPEMPEPPEAPENPDQPAEPVPGTEDYDETRSSADELERRRAEGLAGPARRGGQPAPVPDSELEGADDAAERHVGRHRDDYGR